MPAVISASRRTDIPAFYGEWLLGRLRAGFVEVRNPYNPKQVKRVSLRAQDVDCLVLWTKNPAPLAGRLDELEKLCPRFYFQYTLNDYPRELEPSLASAAERIKTFTALAARLGPERVVWRYDPVIVSSHTDAGYHRRVFAGLCDRLSGHTRRVMISLIDYYKKTEKNLLPLQQAGWLFDKQFANSGTARDLLAELASIARKNSMAIFTCAEPGDYSDIGISPGACVDGELITRLFGIVKKWKKDPGQRKHCRCAESRDIGAYDSCAHGCPYCYATRDAVKAREHRSNHDPGAEFL